MSHMCVSSSVRAAFDLGFDNFVCHDACARARCLIIKERQLARK
ncbi:isochorismatase family protein [Psychrobacter immobilis]|nr:isochorismatase family protein [Psychrobacter immobilis]